MTTPLLIQNTNTDVVVFLELATTGQPATGILFSNVTAGLKKEGGSSFASFTLSGGNWLELGNGYYRVSLTNTDTNTLGSLYLAIQGSLIKNSLTVATVAAAVTAPVIPTAGFTPTLVPIFGYIFDQGGSPKSGVSVVARVVAMPTVLHPVDQGMAVTTDFLVTSTDSTGFFSMNLIVGTTVEFIISDVNYRRTILVPGTTTNLFDIP